MRKQQRSTVFLQEVKDNLQREKRQEEKGESGGGLGLAMLNFVRLRRTEREAAKEASHEATGERQGLGLRQKQRLRQKKT